MKRFPTKTHLLKQLASEVDVETLRTFAKAVNADPFNDVQIQFAGNSQVILHSLKDAPMGVLEDVFDHFFDDSEDEDEDDSETEEEADDENEEDEEDELEDEEE